jgi:hypothetical protein
MLSDLREKPATPAIRAIMVKKQRLAAVECLPLPAIPATETIKRPPPATEPRHAKPPAKMGLLAGMAGVAGSKPPNFRAVRGWNKAATMLQDTE